MRTAWIGAAEASGDALAAALVDALRARGFDGLRGLAGPRMRAAGVTAVARAEDATGFGLVEVATRVPALLWLRERLIADIRRSRPDVVITVDSPDLMLGLGRRARATAPVVHWVAPQVWAWRPGRARRVGAAADVLCCLLPFEPAWFRDAGVRAVFTGHPAAVATDPGPTEPGRVALVPGSRPSEVGRLWPVLREVAARVAMHDPDARFTVAVAPTIDRSALGGLACAHVDGVAEAVRGAEVAVVCSGTASLEVAALRVPQVVIYQVHRTTWEIGRRLVRGVDHVALPNLLAGRAWIPEHLQRLDPDAIAADVERLRGAAGRDQVAGLAGPIASLAADTAVARVADEVISAAARRSSRRARSRTG